MLDIFGGVWGFFFGCVFWVFFLIVLNLQERLKSFSVFSSNSVYKYSPIPKYVSNISYFCVLQKLEGYREC